MQHRIRHTAVIARPDATHPFLILEVAGFQSLSAEAELWAKVGDGMKG
jgi:hypothetical protein